LVGDAKLAGLLAEIVSVDERAGVVVGIGVNLTHEGPDDVLSTTCCAESGVTISRRRCSTSS
jgi:biotin-(acetyl-CoA carboxylase) ligase